MSDNEIVDLVDQDPDLEEDFKGKDWPFSSQGELEDVPMPKGPACVNLSNVLGRASEHSGDFSFGGQAEQLPAIPGIFINEIGPIPVPLWEESAKKLIEKCEKSPFGHNFDTKFDGNVRNSWQLPPDQVQFNNPQWQIGMEKMTVAIAEQLGYKDVPLQCILYKLLIYEQGGHFIKHQDTEKENGMVATLVIQPPSLHEGGDLLVYADGEVKHRHDFGKTNGTATYLPHYAVLYADAEHAVEKVTKGYRLVLVYSVCLPSTIRHLEKNPNNPMAGELAGIIETMEVGDNSFALLLNHEYTKNSVQKFGSGALKGVDRIRFLALEKANASVSAQKKLVFLIAQLYHHVQFYGRYGGIGDWNEVGRDEKVTWYTTGGKSLGSGDLVPVKFNFLNPVQEKYSQFWKKPFGSSDMHSYLGNEGPTKDSEYSRYAIIAWPAIDSVENTVKYVNLECAFGTLQNPDPSMLRKIMDIAAAKVVEGYEIVLKLQKQNVWRYHMYDAIPVPVTPLLCQTLCRVLEDCGDPALVNVFFRIFFKHLQRKSLVAHLIARIVNKYDWNDIGEALLDAFAENDNAYIKEDAEYFMGAVLRVAEKLSRSSAQKMLLKLAVEKAEKLDDDVLSSSHSLQGLWELILRDGDNCTFEAMLNKFKSMSPRLLQSTTDVVTKLLKDTNAPDDRKTMLATIVCCRSEWLASQIRVLDKPFTWEMPAAEFPDNAQVEAFLRGLDQTVCTQGIFNMKDLGGARYFASRYTGYSSHRHHNASFEMDASTCNTFVTISKTRKWYDEAMKGLPLLKEELKNLQNAITKTLVAVISGSRMNE